MPEIYALRPFEAVRWKGDNLDEVRSLMECDPDSAAWTEQRAAEDQSVTVCCFDTNDYMEDEDHSGELWPDDYIVRWGNYYRRFNHKFFEIMFMPLD